MMNGVSAGTARQFVSNMLSCAEIETVVPVAGQSPAMSSMAAPAGVATAHTAATAARSVPAHADRTLSMALPLFRSPRPVTGALSHRLMLVTGGLTEGVTGATVGMTQPTRSA